MKTFNKSLFKKILCVVLVLIVVVLAVVFLVIEAQKQKSGSNLLNTEYVTVYYSIDEECCSIVGQQRQTLKKGGNTSEITIVPKLGYYFMGWVNSKEEDKYFDKDLFTRHEINVQEDIYLTAKFQGPVYSHILFHGSKGGTVEGKLEQTVIYGGRGEPVTAIPNEGYRFVKWSDGETEAARSNQSIKHYMVESASVYAEFERYSRKFEYVYNDGVSVKGETEIEINLDNIDNLVLPVPEREDCKFEGWYSDWSNTVQVTNKNGQMIVGKEWLKNDGIYHYSINPEGYLYAKWTTKKELPTYKILMIYITEVHGDFEMKSKSSSDVENIRVDYLMTEKHRKICNLLTEFMSDYLNAIFNETVRFQVDEYFTTESLNEKVFDYDGVDWSAGPNVKASNGVQETKEIIKDYDSVLTSFSLCGYENDFKLTGGTGGTAYAEGKYATIVLDHILRSFADTDMDKLADYSSNVYYVWGGMLETYIHEYIHTVEGLAVVMDNVGLHSALSYYANNNGGGQPIPYNVYVPFLLNKFEVDSGEYWGIPNDFWLGYMN